MSAERLGACLARLVTYALAACAIAAVLHVCMPTSPFMPASLLLFTGIISFAIVRAFFRRNRSSQGRTEGDMSAA
jgi:ABC-type Co2+ transport system permease subunit